MKKSKKILLIILCITFTIVLVCVPCFAYYSYGNGDYTYNYPTNQLGIPFDVSISGVSPTNYNLLYTIEDFGTVSYDEDYNYTTGIGNKYDEAFWSNSSTTVNQINWSMSRFLDVLIEQYDVNDFNFNEWYNKSANAKFTIEPYGAMLSNAISEFHRNGYTDILENPTEFISALENYNPYNEDLNYAAYNTLSNATFATDIIIDDDVVFDSSALNNIKKWFPSYLDVTYPLPTDVITPDGLDTDFIDGSLQIKLNYSFDIIYLREDINGGDIYYVPVSDSTILSAHSNGGVGNVFTYQLGNARDILYWEVATDWHSNRLVPVDCKIPLNSIISRMNMVLENGVYGFTNLKFSFSIEQMSGVDDRLEAYREMTGNYPFTTVTMGYDGLSTLSFGGETVNTVEYIYGNFADIYNVQAEYVSLNDFNLFEWLGDYLGSLFDVKLFGVGEHSVSLGTILYIGFGIGLVVLVIKFFSGG